MDEKCENAIRDEKRTKPKSAVFEVLALNRFIIKLLAYFVLAEESSSEVRRCNAKRCVVQQPILYCHRELCSDTMDEA